MDDASRIRVTLSSGPLGRLPYKADAGTGASVCFEGIVRPLESDRLLTALDYTAYEPMAIAQLQRLGQQLAQRHGLIAVTVQHSLGRVPVGGCSFRLVIDAEHRKEALLAMEAFIDTMKQEVPIWKSPVFAGREAGVS